MDFKYLLLLTLATCAFTTVKAAGITKAEEAEVDAIVAAIQNGEPSWRSASPVNPPQLTQSYGPPPAVHAVGQSNALPYEAARDNFYGSVGFHKPAGALSINTGGLFAAQSEVLRLLETFLQFKGQLFAHFFAIINNNWELIRGITNFLVTKVPHLHALALKGVSVLRTILEFAVRTFSEWNINLPALSFEAVSNAFVQPPQPHPTYGVPAPSVAGFLENFNRRR